MRMFLNIKARRLALLMCVLTLVVVCGMLPIKANAEEEVVLSTVEDAVYCNEEIDVPLLFINNSDAAIWELYIVPISEPTWGPNLLKKRFISTKSNMATSFKAYGNCLYDVKIVMKDAYGEKKQLVYEYLDFGLLRLDEVHFELKGKGYYTFIY